MNAQYANARKRSVLMVEDDKPYRTFISYLFRHPSAQDFIFMEAGNLDECLKVLCSEIVDVILLDLTLPDSAGLSTLSKITERFANIPIIILTGSDTVGEELKALGLGAQDYLLKHQVSTDGLIRSLRFALERRHFEDSNWRLQVIQGFLNTLADDLRVPLIGCRNVIDSLIEGGFGQVSESQKQALTSLHLSNVEQLNLVERLLDLYKYELDSPLIKAKTLNLKELILSCIQSMPAETTATIRLHFPEHLNYRILGDESALLRLFSNLLDNALRHGDNKGVSISADSSDRNIRLSVHNFGNPLPEGSNPNRLWQGIPGKSYVAKTGMGLYLCQRIVSLHSGIMTISSSKELGTTVSVIFAFQEEIQGDIQGDISASSPK